MIERKPGGAVGTASLHVDDTAGGFAYQGIVGLGFPLDRVGVPGLTLGVEYRYIGTSQPSFTGVVTGPGVSGAVRVDPATHSQNVLVTVRYDFGRGRAAAVPVAAQTTARSFLVFFDFDRADLTPRAREIIGQAAAAARSQQVTRIEVAGHADRAGTPQYNQGLSQRRANTVAGELVRLGVPRTAISVAAFGESRPLVPTADGVREPQNRRVEIILR